jgi:flagellar biosynthesis protein
MKKRYFQAFALDLPKGAASPPVLSARGEYDLANHIVACARKYGIPVVEKPEMCAALQDVELDAEIPVELFEAAAAILAEVGALIPVHKNKTDGTSDMTHDTKLLRRIVP